MASKILYLDFSKNTEIDEEHNRDKIYKIGLREQFEKLPFKEDYESFVTKTLARTDAEVGISFPNFDRNEPKTEGGNKWFNIAVRVHLDDKRYDLVMMCDLNEYTPKNKPIHRSLNVKGFTLIDRDTISCGEREENCDIYTRLDFEGGWYCSNIDPTKYLSEDQIERSVLSYPFLLNLSYSYVAEPHEKVLNKLDKWQKYIDSKNEILEKDMELCYSCDSGPEFIIGYYKNGCTEKECSNPIKHLHIKGSNNIWSASKLNESEAAPLLHFTHDYLKKEYNADGTLKKKFERFTSGRSLLLSEKIIFRQMKRDDGSVKRFPEYKSKIPLQESRISSEIGTEEIPNSAKIDSIIASANKEKAKIRPECEKELSQEVDALLDTYSQKDLPQDIMPYRDAAYAEAEPQVTRERQEAINSDRLELNRKIEKTNAEISEIKGKDVTAVSKMKALNEESDALAASIKKLTTKLTTTKNEKELVETSAKLKKLKNRQKEVNDEIAAIEKTQAGYSSKIIELNNRLQKDEKALDSVESKYNLAEMIEHHISPLLSARKKELLAEKRSSFEYSLRPRYEQIITEKTNAIQKRTDEDIAKVLENETILRLHVFFRLDTADNSEPNEIIERVKSICSGKKMFLYEDPLGEKAILDRQNRALNFLRQGAVMNPFLATALFNSTTQTTRAETEINHFFSKRLNDKQKESIRKAVSSNGMFLIRGPPGTGKTEVIAEITAQLVSQGKKVLIASENHKAVDNAFQRLPEIPILRRVRLFGDSSSVSAKKKNEINQFSVNYLTRNFYNDIAKCLEEEVEKSSNAKRYADRLDEIIADFRKRDSDIQSLKIKADAELKKIDELAAETDRLNKKVSRDLDDNAEYELEISELEETIRAIEDVDSEIFDEQTATVEVTYDGKKLPKETVRALYAIRKTDIAREFKILEENTGLHEILNKRSSSDVSIAKNAEVQLLEYEKEHNLNAFQFKLVKIFQDGIPDRQTVLDLKEQVEDQVYGVIDRLRKKIKETKEICNDTTRNEQAIRNTEKEIQELRSSQTIKEYEGARTKLDADLREILSQNNIAGNFKTISQGIDFLEEEKERIKKTASTGLSEDLQASYKKMSDYLRDESVVEKDSTTLNEDLLEYANVIGLTCTTKDNIKTDVGEVDLKRVNLDVVIVDEVSKVSFLEVLYPILYGKTVILVGDDKQLPPTYQSTVDEEDYSRYDPELVNPELEKEFKRMYESSFFKELYTAMPECNKTMLTVQYRMHPDIMDADNIFYDGKLSYGGTGGEREHYLEIKGGNQRKIITPNTHLMFIDVDGQEIRGYSGGTSRINTQEKEVILYLLKSLEANCTKDRNGKDLGGRKFGERNDSRLSLGVICGYSDQAKIIRNNLKGFKFQSFNRTDDERFMVDTVDNFQGDERDIIILSLVATDTKKSFMTKYNRINVAISRARRLLIVVGNAKSFSNLKIELDGKTDYVYRRIVDSARNHHGYFTKKDVLGA